MTEVSARQVHRPQSSRAPFDDVPKAQIEAGEKAYHVEYIVDCLQLGPFSESISQKKNYRKLYTS